VGGVSDDGLRNIDVLFFDCDDTLYQNNWATAEKLKNSISKFTTDKLNLSKDEAYELYLEHGTALRGLLQEGHLQGDQVEEFLEYVHDVPLEEDIKARPLLREMILKLGHKRRFVFTASIREHAERCLRILGIEDLFEDIIDCRTVNLLTKHDATSFKIAMETANVTDPTRCMLFDDSVKNMKTAKFMGLKTCLVGMKERGSGKKIVCPEADFMVDNLLELPEIMPALFDASGVAVQPAIRSADAVVPATAGKANGDYVGDVSPEASRGERRMIVVLGGPGSGKGTQCAKIKEHLADEVEHLSAGDLLRAEMSDSDSPHRQVISECIKEGKLVPSAMTMRLIVQAMNRSRARLFLIDGCPRDQDNLENFEEHIVRPGEARLIGVFFYDCPEDEMLQRILKRAETSGRTDDNVESAKKRFATFNNSTLPVIEQYRAQDVVFTFDATKSIDSVATETISTVSLLLKGSADALPSKHRKPVTLTNKVRRSLRIQEEPAEN
jgi:putative hydrolase of the HAD superfamily/pyrimidine and pyridine-specific 5'-nucleotidase